MVDLREEALALEFNLTGCEGISKTDLADLYNKHWTAQKSLDKFLAGEISPADLFDVYEWAGVDMDIWLMDAEDNLETFDLI